MWKRKTWMWSLPFRKWIYRSWCYDGPVSQIMIICFVGTKKRIYRFCHSIYPSCNPHSTDVKFRLLYFVFTESRHRRRSRRRDGAHAYRGAYVGSYDSVCCVGSTETAMLRVSRTIRFSTGLVSNFSRLNEDHSEGEPCFTVVAFCDRNRRSIIISLERSRTFSRFTCE